MTDIRLNKQAASIWSAIDTLARKNNMTSSALARRSGLDATAFNKSKRMDPMGHYHLPSMKSIIKVLLDTNSSWHDFADLLSQDAEH